MPDTRMLSWTHHDAQDDEKIIACYADIGLGPAVVFDGGGFTDPEDLLSFVVDLNTAAAWLRQEKEGRSA